MAAMVLATACGSRVVGGGEGGHDGGSSAPSTAAGSGGSSDSGNSSGSSGNAPASPTAIVLHYSGIDWTLAVSPNVYFGPGGGAGGGDGGSPATDPSALYVFVGFDAVPTCADPFVQFACGVVGLEVGLPPELQKAGTVLLDDPRIVGRIVHGVLGDYPSQCDPLDEPFTQGSIEILDIDAKHVAFRLLGTYDDFYPYTFHADGAYDAPLCP